MDFPKRALSQDNIRAFFAIFLSVVLLVFLLPGCDKDKPLPDFGYEYFPLKKGDSTVYRLDSIIYNSIGTVDTFSYLVEEVVADTFRDNENRLTYEIQRSIRKDSTAEWQINNIWAANRTEGGAEWIENNLRFLKLVFPLREGKLWNGSIYLGPLGSIPVNESCNNLAFLENWDYEYVAVHTAESIGTFSFDSTLTVEQNGATNLTELNTATEIYAKNVGLVYREFYHLTTQNICPTCPWEENAECGYIVRQTVLDFSR